MDKGILTDLLQRYVKINHVLEEYREELEKLDVQIKKIEEETYAKLKILEEETDKKVQKSVNKTRSYASRLERRESLGRLVIIILSIQKVRK